MLQFVLVIQVQAEITLLDAVDIALRQSDTVMDLEDSLVLAEMDVDEAQHQFTTRLVPRTQLGVIQGTGSQRVGMELRKDFSTGMDLRYGVDANRLDENGDYVLTNPVNAKVYAKLSQPLLRRSGQEYNLTGLNIEQLRQKAKRFQSEQRKQKLILQTVTAYYDVVLADQLLKKTKKALLRSRENLESAKSRQVVGRVSKVDVYRAELALLNGQSSLTARKRILRKSKNSLLELLRLAEDENVTIAGTISSVQSTLQDTWPDDVLELRYDWHVQQVHMEINRIERQKAEKDLLPDVALSFSVEQKGTGDSFGEAVELDENNWSFQVEMLSDFDSFSEKTALQRTRMTGIGLQRAKAALKRKILNEVKEAFEDVRAEQENCRIHGRKLQQARTALDYAKTRYEQGVSDNLDLIDADKAYSDAQFDGLKAQVAYNLAAVSLAYKTGELSRDGLASLFIQNGTVPSCLGVGHDEVSDYD